MEPRCASIDETRSERDEERFLAAAVSDIPTGAMVESAEIAELVCFALRSSQRSLNGATLDVNGGGLGAMKELDTTPASVPTLLVAPRAAGRLVDSMRSRPDH